jgi:hypothetical protein
MRLAGAGLASALASLVLCASASAASVVNVTSPQNNAIYYTGSNATAVIPVSATLSSDCDAGLWYIRENPPGGPYGPYIAGGLIGTNPLQKTDNRPPGRYEYSGHVNCTDPAGDPYTTNFVQITVIAGDPPGSGGGGGGGGSGADQTPPKGKLSGKKTQKAGGSVSTSIRCSEACKATISGTVNVGQKHFKLKAAKRSLTANKTVQLKLAVPRKVRSAERSAFEHHKHVNAKLKIVLTDAAGNDTSLTRTIKLTR